MSNEQTWLPPVTETLVQRFPAYPDVWSFHPSERWVRGFVDGTAVVDSHRQLLVWEPRHKVPEYGFPLEDVRTDLLVETDAPEGDLGYYRPRRPPAQWFDLHVGDRVVKHAAWRWPAPELAGFLGVSWFPGVLDRWLEEEQPVFAHPRDPFSRVDALPSSRRVTVSRDGVVLADSDETVVVYETGLIPRYYFPPEHVRFDLLAPATTLTECPYKGHTTGYWSTADGALDDIAWTYGEPSTDVIAIAGRIAFYTERLDLTVDGVPA
ncbi:DUF427 domain-containing protein [Leifsonia sp. NPDC014704]|uniref:DUF427 domain-containing protein n=1 Tax=Leifsonia sp. NPDC014704 TaxID=3364123 RepID=UPI0036F46438